VKYLLRRLQFIVGMSRLSLYGYRRCVRERWGVFRSEEIVSMSRELWDLVAAATFAKLLILCLS